MIYALLPDYFSLEINSSLPLIQASRIMLVILFFYVMHHVKVKTAVSLCAQLLKPTTPANMLIALYFLLRIVSNLYYIFTYGTAVKTIFSICFEELMLMLLFCIQFTTQTQIERAIKGLVNLSGVLFALGIFESISRIDLGHYLYTADRALLNEYFIRLGLLRTDLTFGLPSFYATYCVMLVPFILYIYEKTFQKRYLVILTLDVFAVIHAGSRAQLLILGVLIVVTWLLQHKDMKIHYLKIYGKLLLISCGILLVLSLSSSHLRYYYTGTAKSLLNTVGFEFDLNEGAPEGVTGYGSNTDGTYSRIAQFSGIPYALHINPLFGLGAGAQNRGDVMYLWKGTWKNSNKYDVAYVAMIMDGGLIGFAGFMLLYASSFLLIWKNRGKLNTAFLFAFIAYLLCLFSINTLDHFYWLIFALFYSYNRTERKQT